MKYLKTAIILICILSTPSKNFAQDSLLKVDLLKHIRHFQIIDNKIIGEGVQDFFEKEAKENQYFLLGEFHGSPGISKLTQTLIPILDKAGFDNFGLEVGPCSVDFLKDFSKKPSKTVQQLNDFNSKYYIKEDDGYINTPIPFFKSVEDAEFLKTAAEHQWSLIGLDQEYFFSFIPLVDKMYAQLNKEEQNKLAGLFQEAKDSIHHFYKLDEQDKNPLPLSIRDSKTIHSFFKKAVRANNKNKAIVAAIQKTVQIYGFNATRKYYSCNKSRIEYMKENLKAAFDLKDFNYEKDKLFLKMGGVHTAKGFSWLSIYEIGNTLAELADFNNNKSIHITFQSRYYYKDGKVMDDLDKPNSYCSRYIDFTQFAEKDKWTIIDLRPVKIAMFYPQKYKVSEFIKRTFEQHDLIIIPPLEKEGNPNYKE